MPELSDPPHLAPAAATAHGYGWRTVARQEWFLCVSLLTSLIFFAEGPALFGALSNPAMLLVVFAWLFGVALGSIMAVVRHADLLAIRLGEPYGTLILTLSVVAVEVVSISAVSLQGHGEPTLARDTLFAVVMILLNGMVGLA